MPSFCKIPQEVKKTGCVAIGHYAVFCKSAVTAAQVATVIRKHDLEKGIPAVGFLTIKGKKFYYCRYGFVNDPDIYAKPIKKKSAKPRKTK